MGLRRVTAIKNKMRECQRPPEAGGKPPLPPHPEPAPFDFDRAEQLCKELAHEEVVVRDRAIADTPALLKKLEVSSDANLGVEFAKVWKGLFYCMWHSDKPLVQLDCADRVAALTGLVGQEARAEWVQQGWACMERHWHMIDKWRVDKYYALMRRMLNSHLTAWATDTPRAQLYAASLLTTYSSPRLGLGTHISDCLVEECVKVGFPHSAFLELVRTVLIPTLSQSKSRIQCERIKQRVFDRLAGKVVNVTESDEAVEWISDARWDEFGTLIDDAATARETGTGNRALLVSISEGIEVLLEQTAQAGDMGEEMDTDEEEEDMRQDARKKITLDSRKTEDSVATKQADKRKKRRAQREIKKLSKKGDDEAIRGLVRKAVKDGVKLKKPKKQKGRGGLDKALRVADNPTALQKQQKLKKRKRRV